MSSDHPDLYQEKNHLKRTLVFIKNEINELTQQLTAQTGKLLKSRKEMWNDTAHHSNDFIRLTEINQYFSEVKYRENYYINTLKSLKNYKAALPVPYFGRFDFVEDGYNDREKIYIGRQGLIDSKKHHIYVYDWRAPISSIFYQYEPGKASYTSPAGDISGVVNLKRQYEIVDSKLQYFFDCSLMVRDKVLQEVLSNNSSIKMKTIVETIQKEQDIIIRDTDTELLIVQGVAGSGKSSIALHRIAYLLYQTNTAKLNSNNVMIISPNNVFTHYISSVLPELGEEGVLQKTFFELVCQLFNNRFLLENRENQLEILINTQQQPEGQVRKKCLEFKGSQEFIKVLDRWLWYYAHQLIEFKDVYFAGSIVANKQELKNRFLNNKTGIPLARQLERIENMLLVKYRPLQKARLQEIEKFISTKESHQLEIKSYSRLLSIKLAQRFKKQLKKFTEIDYWEIYKKLFNNWSLFIKLTQDINLPEDIKEIFQQTRNNLTSGKLYYEDYAPLLYLLLRIEGNKPFPSIKEVIIDEAQDYYPIQYAVFKLLFSQDTHFSIFGDIHQTIERESSHNIYSNLDQLLQKQKTRKLSLNKGYRSSYEISQFTKNFLDKKENLFSFERHGSKPKLIFRENQNSIKQALLTDLEEFKNKGYKTTAIICKSRKVSEELFAGLCDLAAIKLIDSSDKILENGVVIIPAYLAKGLEFDAVIVYDAGSKTYFTPMDKNLLYIACSRALHQLTIYYTGRISPFIR